MEPFKDKEVITERYIEAINIINSQLFGIIKNHIDEIKPVFPLIRFILERIEGVIQLTTTDRIWDAEILNRTVLETLLKFVYITTADDTQKEIRINEYWNDLEEINRIKQSDQAKKNIQAFGHIEIMKVAYSPNILNSEEELRLKTKWNKKRRQQTEQKWSFTEILNSLIENYRGVKMEMLVGLAHTYRMASHIGHGDEIGILIISERRQRNEEQEAIANFAHYLRLISDSYSFCGIIALETMKFLNKDSKIFSEIFKSLEDIHNLSRNYSSKVFNDPLYDNYK